nr:GNAT family N-acetyltransferase [uncultured Roseateles sp.]
MPTPAFIPADPVEHRDALLSLNIEYMTWVFGQIELAFDVAMLEITRMSVPDYAASAIDKVCGERPPQGVFYLIEMDGQIAGMGGLRFVRRGVAEVKRLYVRPAWRGRNLGELALRKLLTDAASFGYQSVCLDSAPFMTSAHRLYEAQGFVDCAAYEGTEVPSEFHARWRFMQRPVILVTPSPAADEAPAQGRLRARRSGVARSERRQQILQAVRQLHAEGGNDNVTMRTVAQRVGMPTMSVYRYFPNKSALLESVWAELLEASLGRVRARRQASDTALERLRSLYEEYISFWLERPADFRLVFDTDNKIPPGSVAGGAATGFRQECESLIDACLGADAGLARRMLAYDLCRAKVIGFLFTAIGLSTRPATALPALLAATLDDIEQQLRRAA